jgi:F0F1-type ATP synthase assembly protein I
VTAPQDINPWSGWYRSGARRRTDTMGSVTLDDARRMSNSAWVNSSRLISGLLLYTGLGWLVSLWVGHRALLMTVGAFVGLGLSYYLMFTSLEHERRRDEARRNGEAS